MPNRKGNRKHRYDWLNFGRSARRRREELGWTRSAVARRLGLDDGTLKHAEEGERGLCPERRRRLIDLLEPETDEPIALLRRLALLRLAGLPSAMPARLASAPFEASPHPRETPQDDPLWTPSSPDASAALAVAHQALEALRHNSLEEARGCVARALRLLRVPEFTPKDGLRIERLRDRLGGQETTWRAYAVLALVDGRLAMDGGQAEAAERAFRAFAGVGQELGDGPMQADACHWLGRLLYAMGTTVVLDETRAHRRVAQGGLVVQSFDAFTQAAQQRPAHQEREFALDLLRSAQAARLLGGEYAKAADKAEKQIDASLAASVTLHLRRHQGRQALMRRADEEAFAVLSPALDQAWQKWSPFQAADTLGMLGELYAAHGGSRALALAHFATALLTWPGSAWFRPKDYERYDRLLKQLAGTPKELQDALMRSDSPLRTLIEMPGSSPLQIQERARRRLKLQLIL
jgi:transcriptional regulator with XRE-family HTH domain